MPKFHVNPELVKLVLSPTVLGWLKDAAEKTSPTWDDKLVAALIVASQNQMLMAVLLAVLAGDEVPAVPAELATHAANLASNATTLRGLLPVAIAE
jgi:hypothetical protein